MKFIRYFSYIFLLVITVDLQSAIAEWTFLTYIQADNNLWNYAYYNINDMQLGVINNALVNVLVQWDQPGNNRTWRYKIVNGGRIEDASLTTEMGINTSQELIDCASWIKNKYPAKKYAWVLWNHGSGVEDKAIKNGFEPEKYKYSWIELPGNDVDTRGILYDDTQHTYLSTQALYSTFSKIINVLGKKIDVFGMDACLMAMIEIGYQIKDFAEVFVGSEQTEPGDGWAYSTILNSLTLSPTSISAITLGQIIVAAYAKLYKQIGETDYTQSAINLSDLSTIKTNIDDVVTKVAECKKYKSSNVKNAIITARNNAVSFYIASYIDLYSFYSNLITQVQKLKSQKVDIDTTNKRRPSPKPRPKPKPVPTPTPSSQTYLNALTALETSLKNGLALISNAVKANTAGSADSGAKGISIYYPHPRYPATQITSNYKNIAFAQQSKWLQFITDNRGIV